MLTQETSQHIAAFVQSHLAVQPTAGVSVGITDREKTLSAWSYGFANLEGQLPLTPAHLMQIGSIGKSFTSLVLMQLFEEGLFDPQTPVLHYLPWLKFRNGGAEVTCHHLLTHSSGLIMGTDEAITSFGEAWVLREIPVQPPAGRFHYSNTGYKILGLVVEKLTGMPYADVLRERVLEPLGMRFTEPTITNAAYSRHATGYQPFPFDRTIHRPFSDKARLAPAPWVETDTADGCISSTPSDMAIYVRSLMNGFAPLIRPETFAMMTAPQIAVSENEPSLHYSYGLDVIEEEGVKMFAHGGGMVGYTANLRCRPDPGIGVIVLMNGPGGSAAIARFAVECAVAERLGSPLPDIPEPPDYFNIAEENGFAGEYHGLSRSIRIEKRGNGLGIAGVKPNLALRAADTLHIDDPAWNEFFISVKRDDAGAVEALRYGGEVYYRDALPADIKSAPEEWLAFAGEYIAYNPWYPGFRIALQEDRLILMSYFDDEELCSMISPGEFRIGDEGSPETVRFDTIVDGKARRAVYSGAVFYRKS